MIILKPEGRYIKIQNIKGKIFNTWKKIWENIFNTLEIEQDFLNKHQVHRP